MNYLGGSERESELEDNGTAANNETNHETAQSNPEHPTDPNQSDSDADGGTTEPPTLIQTMTKLLQAQTQAMAAQALATAVHHLPPLPYILGRMSRLKMKISTAGWSVLKSNQHLLAGLRSKSYTS